MKIFELPLESLSFCIFELPLKSHSFLYLASFWHVINVTIILRWILCLAATEVELSIFGFNWKISDQGLANVYTASYDSIGLWSSLFSFRSIWLLGSFFRLIYHINWCFPWRTRCPRSFNYLRVIDYCVIICKFYFFGRQRFPHHLTCLNIVLFFSDNAFKEYRLDTLLVVWNYYKSLCCNTDYTGRCSWKHLFIHYYLAYSFSNQIIDFSCSHFR